jgi:hypothetical protein
MTSEKFGSMEIYILNNIGQLVKVKNNISVHQGENVITIDGLQELNTGFYFMTLKDDSGEVSFYKVLKH